MRIALVSREYPPGRMSGGIGTYTQKTARALALLGQEVHVFTEGNPEAPGSGAFEPTVHRLPEIYVRPDEHRAVRRAWAVARALRRTGPFDLVQACEFDAEAIFFALDSNSPLVTRLATPTYVVSRLNGGHARQRLRTATLGPLERLQTKLSARIISPSRVLADLVTRDWHLEPRRVSVVPTGIEIPTMPSAPPPHGMAGRKYALYFGRLEMRKGTRTWIDALPAVLAEHNDLWAVFAGRDLGMSGTSFEAYAAQRLGPLMSRVAFFPRLPPTELFPLVAGSALVVMPSIWESLANACLEAMALGRPVVATTGSGFAEVISDGVDGILVEPGNHRQLADAVIGALTRPDHLMEIGRAAQLRARDFDLEKMAARLLELYQLLAKRPSAQPMVDAAQSANP